MLQRNVARFLYLIWSNLNYVKNSAVKYKQPTQNANQDNESHWYDIL